MTRVNQTSDPQLTGRAALLPFWTAGEVLKAGDRRVNPDGQTIKRTADGTARSSYDATEAALWTVVSGGGGSGSVAAADITDSTATGRSLIRAADGSAARSTIGAGTSSFSGSYGDLSDRPNIPPAYTDEQAQDAAAAMITSAAHVGLSVAYDDAGNGLKFTVASPGEVLAKPTGPDLHLVLNSLSTTPIATYTPLGMTAGSGVYGPTAVDAQGKIANPIARYYMLVSTDHDPGQGGLHLLTSPTPVGPWTPYVNAADNNTARVFYDPSGISTETPWIVWNPVNRLFYVYYQQGGLGGNQGTALAVTADFITWERIGGVILSLNSTLASNSVPGDNHTGYAYITRLARNRWVAVHLSGGTSYSHRSISYSYDGVQWVTDVAPMLGGAESYGELHRNGTPFGQVFKVQGEWWSLGNEKDYSSATSTGQPINMAGPVSADWRRWARPPQVCWQPTYDWERQGVSFGGRLVADDGSLYFYYVAEGTDPTKSGLGVAPLCVRLT